MPSQCPPADGSAPKTRHFDGLPPMCIDLSKRYTAEMATSKGTMVFALDAVSAPRTVNNFVFLPRGSISRSLTPAGTSVPSRITPRKIPSIGAHTAAPLRMPIGKFLNTRVPMSTAQRQRPGSVE